MPFSGSIEILMTKLGYLLKENFFDFLPGARFSKLPVITGPVKLFCFPFQMGVSKGLKIVQ